MKFLSPSGEFRNAPLPTDDFYVYTRKRDFHLSGSFARTHGVVCCLSNESYREVHDGGDVPCDFTQVIYGEFVSQYIDLGKLDMTDLLYGLEPLSTVFWHREILPSIRHILQHDGHLDQTEEHPTGVRYFPNVRGTSALDIHRYRTISLLPGRNADIQDPPSAKRCFFRDICFTLLFV